MGSFVIVVGLGQLNLLGVLFGKKGNRTGPRKKERVQSKVVSLCFVGEGLLIGASSKVNLSILYTPSG